MEHHGSGRRARGASEAHSPLATAALSGAQEAARALERACRKSRETQDAERRSLYLETVEDLARDLGDDLDSLARNPNVSASSGLVSAALRAADLSTLAACALPGIQRRLQPQSADSYQVAAAAHAASGAARSLALEHRSLVAKRGETEDNETEGSEDYAAYDLRGAEWRASLAARQTDEALQTED